MHDSAVYYKSLYSISYKQRKDTQWMISPELGYIINQETHSCMDDSLMAGAKSEL